VIYKFQGLPCVLNCTCIPIYVTSILVTVSSVADSAEYRYSTVYQYYTVYRYSTFFFFNFNWRHPDVFSLNILRVDSVKTQLIWVKRDRLDVTCFIISLFNAQHVSDANTSILRSLRLICWVIPWLYCSGSMCVGVTLWFGCGGVVSVCRFLPAYGYHTTTTKPQRNTNTHRTRSIQPMK